MNRSFLRKYPAGSDPVSVKTDSASGMTGWILALAAVLALLPFGHGFRSEWPVPQSGQPAQMSSKVDYDPKLTDPFFKSNEWSYWYGGQEIISGMTPEGEDPARLKHTAKCFSTPFGRKHLVRLCDARLLDVNTIDLYIHESNPAYDDDLIIQIRNGMFTCQYRTFYKAMRDAGFTWTTTRQKLTLDKKVYRKGDVIKGRIDFECVQEPTKPKYIEEWGRDPITFKVYGVFETVLE
jgi:hypothetical protein